MSAPFLFSTDLENSHPRLPIGRRVDEMEDRGWREDFALAREIGVGALRYGPACYRTHVAPGKYDWSSADEPIHLLHDQGTELIANLCHLDIPDWLGGYQDPAFPVLFAEYARAFARRYPWVRYYTPINEIFNCASYSARRGSRNEGLSDDRAFVRAMRNLCMGHELAVEAILGERSDAIIVQTESIERSHPESKIAEDRAARENTIRHLSLDLTLGRHPGPGMASFLNQHGVTSNDLSFFREKRAVGQRWLGLDYTPSREPRVALTGASVSAPTGVGFRLLPAEYYSPYRIPLFRCAANGVGQSANDLLAAQWEDIAALRSAGIPVMGLVWCSLADGFDSEQAVRTDAPGAQPVGLFDSKRRITPVGLAYRDLIAANRDLTVNAAPARRREA